MEVQAKYEIIKKDLISAIEEGRFLADEKIPSENELCRQYGTSRITVRKAIDELAVMGLVYRVQGVGTFVADRQQKAKKKQRILVIVSDSGLFLGSRMMYQIMQGVDGVVYKNGGVSVYIREPKEDEELRRAFLEQVRMEKPDGIIYLFYSGSSVVDELASLEVPIVFIDTEPKKAYGDVVVGEDYTSAYQAAKQMISQGIRRIGYFCIWEPLSSVAENRCRGIVDALEEEGIAYRREWILKKRTGIRMEFFMQNQEILEEAKRYLRENPELEAVITMNDNNACMVCEAASALNIRIPENLKLISYGNYDFCEYLGGGLTSFDQNFDKYGKEAAKLLLNRLEGKLPEEPQRRFIKYQLQRRGSF